MYFLQAGDIQCTCYRQVVFVARNPKDWLVSSFHSSVSIDGYNATLEQFVEDVFNGNSEYKTAEVADNIL